MQILSSAPNEKSPGFPGLFLCTLSCHPLCMDELDKALHISLDGLTVDALSILSLTTAEQIALKYPGRIVLNPSEVADVWKGSTTRATVNGIRDRLTAGTLIPGLAKDGGRWAIPVADLIRVVDGMADEVRQAALTLKGITPSAGSPRGSGGQRPWRAPIGRRPGVYSQFEQSADAWHQVYIELDALDALDVLASLGDRVPSAAGGAGCPRCGRVHEGMCRL